MKDLLHMKSKILFESDSLLVINKPAGLRVHPDGKSDKETLIDWILAEYPEIKGVGEPMMIDGTPIDRPGIVHRLDEETSGVMIIAKTQKSFEYLKGQFQSRSIHKQYHSFVWGHFKEREGVIDEPIGRNKNDFRRWHAGRGIRGEMRDARTKWNCAAQFVDENGEQFSFMHLFPETGRTHQLRVHMKFIQRPIVSDRLYAPTKPLALGFDRVALHARSITFTAPNGEEMTVTAPYPPDFESALAKYLKA
jgi:23S rRNA pseudouridine1911/1915/1917 synthase